MQTDRYNSCLSRRHLLALVLVLGLGDLASGQNPAELRAQASLDAAVQLFARGRIAESLAEFDGLLRIAPDLAPSLWQRGIALYYAGRYAECRRQFELHRTVNPDDVENAAWHFLCVARQESPDRARAALLPVGPDDRVPMRQIYEMLRGTLTPDQVMAASGPTPRGRFYGLLYTGLYFEATGDARRAVEQIKAAADGAFADAGGYMHMVARVDLALARTR
jgi:lipoprotein NlpI